jgi:hypothetical protein
LYGEYFGEKFDPGEFLADDFYAFQVLERAFQIGGRNRELHNLAVLMHAERKALMETGMRRTLDTIKVESQREVQRSQTALVPPMTRAGPPSVPAPVAAPAPASRPQAVPVQITPLRAAGAPERRVGKVRLSSREITMVSAMRGHYRKHFGQGFDVEEFAGNDLYAKVVLAEALASGQAELINLASHFLDDGGKPRIHRRKGQVDLDIGIEKK